MKLLRIAGIEEDRIYRLRAEELDEFYEDQRRKWRGFQHRTRRRRDGEERRMWDFVCPVGTALLRLLRGGEVIEARVAHNLVVDTGLAAAIDRLQGNTPAVHDFLAVGTNNTAPAAGDTTLNTEIGTRVQGTLSQPDAETDRCVGTFAAGNATGALVEAGRLNAGTNGNLFSRLVFAVVNKGAGDSFQLTYDITVS